MKYLLYALLTAGTVSVSYTALVDLYRTAHIHLLQIEALRDQGTIQAARTAWMLDGKEGNPTVEQLIEAGYIADSFRTRPTVGEPLQLPAELPQEGAAQ